MPRVLSIGEAMVELRAIPAGFAAAVAGDAFNTAAWLARRGAAVTHAQDLGDDLLRTRIRAALEQRGVRWHGRCLAAVRNGMYIIDVDDDGERRFEYFRAGSAAGATITADTVPALAELAAHHDLLFLTGITVAITADDDALEDLLDRVQAPVAIAWNVRAGLHRRRADGAIIARPPQDVGRRLDALCRRASVVLASEDDLALGLPGHAPEATAWRLADRGATVVLTRGASGSTVWHAGSRQEQPAIAPPHVSDTAGAGDAFAAGFLDGWLSAPNEPLAAAAAGAASAAEALAGSGALPPA
jgi:2-dehydro-3-deoxygluconokinase